MEPPRGGGWGPGSSGKDDFQGLFRDTDFESQVRAHLLLNPRFQKRKKPTSKLEQSAFLSLQVGKPLLAVDKHLPSIPDAHMLMPA